LIDEPSVQICESALRDAQAMRSESEQLVEEFPVLRVRPAAVPAEVVARFAAAARVCDYRDDAQVAP
jgi:hypothetical protein